MPASIQLQAWFVVLQAQAKEEHLGFLLNLNVFVNRRSLNVSAVEVIGGTVTPLTDAAAGAL